MAVKNKVEVRIAGKDYTLVGVEPDEYIQKIALYIDRKMNEILRVNSKLSTSMAAVLTAINVADDYFKTYESEGIIKKELKHLKEELEKMRGEYKTLSEENSMLGGKCASLQLDLTKREAELNEARSSLDKVTKAKEL